MLLVVLRLVQLDANVDAKDNDGRTALNYTQDESIMSALKGDNDDPTTKFWHDRGFGKPLRSRLSSRTLRL